MPAPASLLAQLRRSALGAWLASLYALAVLAAVLAPSAGLSAHATLESSVLCSGEPAPGPDEPAPLHCQGCPVNPHALSPEPPRLVAGRIARRLPAAPRLAAGRAHKASPGLPQPRGPPSAQLA